MTAPPTRANQQVIDLIASRMIVVIPGHRVTHKVLQSVICAQESVCHREMYQTISVRYQKGIKHSLNFSPEKNKKGSHSESVPFRPFKIHDR